MDIGRSGYGRHVFPRRRKVPPELMRSWRDRQEELTKQLLIEPLRDIPRLVAGVDCAFDGDDVLCVAVVWDRDAGQVVEAQGIRHSGGVPYVPGFLSFREGPAVHAALDALTTPIGLVLIDGQGIAHPRRCGLATHVGVERDIPTVGVAKSRLVGTHDEPGPATGDTADLMHQDACIGRVLRTRVKVKPLFISVGHRVDLDTAVAAVLACRTKYRLPEPTRQADKLVAQFKRDESI